MSEAEHTNNQSGLADFCARLGHTKGVASSDLALAILCWYDQRSPGKQMSTWDLTKLLTAHGLANPNRAVLASKLSRSSLTLKVGGDFRLRAGAQEAIRERFPAAFDAPLPRVNLESGYLPQEVWRETRGYLENVCRQLNGCHQFAFYDAASVMVRRVLETLIIEAYEHLHKEKEIRDSDENYFMLGELVSRCTGSGGLTLGREAKATLKDIKKLGDRSAHNRRYNAVRADLDDIRSGVRVAVDELINIASIRRAR